MSELSHTVSVKRGPMMKAFINVYEVSPKHSNITTCHLFWGFLFLVPAFVFKMIATVTVIPALDLLDRRAAKKRNTRSAAYDEQFGSIDDEQIEPKRQDSWMLNALKSAASFFGSVWFKVQPTLPWIGRGLGVLLALGLIALIVLFPLNVLKFVLIVLASVAVGTLVIGIILVVLWLAEKADAGRAFKKAAHSVHDHTCATISFKD